MKKAIEISEVDRFLMTTLNGVKPASAWGETSYFYNPGNKLPRGTYFATIKEKDGPNDKASNLNRDNVWRLNLGVTRSTFENLFGLPPVRPEKGQSIKGPWDFQMLDTLTPHPVYGWMSWLSVLCPKENTFEVIKPLLLDAHGRAMTTFQKRVSKIS